MESFFLFFYSEVVRRLDEIEWLKPEEKERKGNPFSLSYVFSPAVRTCVVRLKQHVCKR